MEKKTVSAISFHHLTVNYGSTTALWDISLEIPKGKIVGIIGPNGAGKSTLLKTALGMIKPFSGNVTFSGSPLKKVRKKIAYIPQRESVDWNFPITVKELVLMGAYGNLSWFKKVNKQLKEQAMDALDLVGMADFKERQIQHLSGGQQQRVFIARALMQKADIYFMDEPFTGIDCATEQLLMTLFKDLRKEGKTVLVVHHDLNTVSLYFDWIVMLNLRLICSGEMKTSFNSKTIHQTYGKHHLLLDEAIKLARDQSTGLG